MNTPDEVRQAVRDLSASWWALTTLGTALEAGVLDAVAEPASAAEAAARCSTDAALVESMLDVLASIGLVKRDGAMYSAAPGLVPVLRGPMRAAMAADLRSTLLQGRDFYASGLEKKLVRGWSFTDPQILEAQGAGSGQFAEVFVGKLVPMLAGMPERFARGATFLDVGSGVGHTMIELCRRVPLLRAVGLEPAVTPMQLARKNVDASGFADRIELRSQLVQDMPDVDAFDLAWLPGVFLPDPVLDVAIERVHASLRPGGWILTPTLSTPGDDLRSALGRMRNVMWGGDRVTSESMQDRLAARGFAGAYVLPMPSVGAKLIAARKAE
jgi:SAM-dependent methyltransferase